MLAAHAQDRIASGGGFDVDSCNNSAHSAGAREANRTGRVQGFWSAELMGTALPKTLDAVDVATTASCGLWPWTELARRQELDVEGFCAKHGIDLTQLRQPFARWSQRASNSIAQFVCDQLGSDAAMAAALTVEAGHFQLLELLVRTAPTVGDGLRLGCMFFPLLHNGGKLRHEQLESGAHAVTWLPPQDYLVHHAYVELTFGVTVLGIRREARSRRAAAAEVSLCRPAPEQTISYERVLGCRPLFGMHEDRIVFDRRVAALNMARSNAEVHENARTLAHELIGSDDI